MTLLSFADSRVDEIIPKLEYAQFCVNNLNDIDKAITIYDELIPKLIQDKNDSVLLVVESERIELLLRTGNQREVLSSMDRLESLASNLVDYDKLSYFQFLKAHIYAELGFESEALKISNQALENTHLIQDENRKNLNLGYLYYLKAYVEDSDQNKIFHLINGYKSFMKVDAKHTAFRKAQVMGNSMLASAFTERNQLDSAKYYLLKSISFMDSRNRLTDDHYALINFANLHFQMQNYDEAEKWYLRALEQAEKEKNLDRQTRIYYKLFRCKFMQHTNAESNSYLLKYVSLKDTFESTRLKNINFVEKEIGEEMNEKLMEVNKKHKSSLIGFAGATVLLCLVLGTFFYKRKKEQKKDSIKIIENSEIKDEEDISVERINILNNLVKRNDPSFILKFNEAFPNFTKNINDAAKVPLTQSEVEICAYTKLNFTTKEIALYRKDTIRSVENRKYRIRKKLMLTPETDFVVWVASIH